MPGNSLGRRQTGATAAGPVWAEYMKIIHADLEAKNFEVPRDGLVFMEICNDSGEIPDNDCSETREEVYLAGTEPETLDIFLVEKERQDSRFVRRMRDRLQLMSGIGSYLGAHTQTQTVNGQNTVGDSVSGNPLLD